METVMNTVVIDTETLDTKSSAIVLSLSAIRFNRFENEVGIGIQGGKLIEEGPNQLHLLLNIGEQLLLGRTTSASTIAWWDKQDKEARASVVANTTTQVKDALEQLAAFIGDAQVYCRGTDFDPPILASLYKAVGLKTPWKYNAVRDVRTYIDALTCDTKGYIEGFQAPDWLIPHNSLHDCIRDAMQMQKANDLN